MDQFSLAAAWHRLNPGIHLRLRLALMEASQWLAEMANREQCINILASPDYLDLSERVASAWVLDEALSMGPDQLTWDPLKPPLA